MFSRPSRIALILLAIVSLALPAWALINPKFTPIQLAADSDTIVTVKIKGKPIGDTINLEVTGVLKGKAPAHLALSLAKTARQHADVARKQLADYGGEDSLFFIGKDENEQSAAFMHIHGMWLKLLPGENDVYPLDIIDRQMPSTWAGGTDMLARCIRYIQADSNADVPVQAGMEWQSATKIATLPLPAREMMPVDLTGDGKPLLFVASEKGDRLLKPAVDAFEDVTEKLKLHSASRLAAWGNFSGGSDADARLELASYDGTNLTIWSQAADGTFTSAKAGGTFKLPPDCVGMTVIAAGASKKQTGLLISSTSGSPVVLTPVGNNAFESVVLPAAQAQSFGAAGPCIVADFTGDGVADIIQPCEKGGLFYAGNANSFDAPKACEVCYGQGGGRAAIGDFDADGLSDILIAGPDGVKIFQNLGKGNFEEQRDLSGEVAYKAQPQATCCTVGDFNGDARPDMIIGYSSQNPQVFFNRGFRSFGEAAHLECDEAPSQIPDITKGQQLVLLADLIGAGAHDFYLLSSTGDLWRAANSMSGDQPTSLSVRISPKSALIGPITISLWQDKHCLGSAVARAGTAQAFFGIANANTYTLKWMTPAGKPQSKDIVVDKAVTVMLDDHSGSGN